MHHRVRACIIGILAIVVTAIGTLVVLRDSPPADSVVVRGAAPDTTATSSTTSSTTTSTTIDLEGVERYVQTLAAIRYADALHMQRLASRHSNSPPAQQRVQYGTGACGGDLPPCWVMMRESGGNIRAKNPSSSASGKWQILDSTWNGYGGYAHAMDAPEEVQDAKARSLGICHWSPPNYCAG